MFTHLIFIYIILLSFAGLLGIVIKRRYQRYNRVINLPGDKKLSGVSQQLIKEYDELPVENRPFPDIVSILTALDERTEEHSDDRLEHFNSRNCCGARAFSWTSNLYGDCTHISGECRFSDYASIHYSILNVRESMDALRRAEIEARTQADVDQIEELNARLADESTLMHEHAKKFRELS